MPKDGGVNYVQIGTTAALAIGFTLLVILIGARAVNRIRGRVENLKVGQSYLIFGLSLCLGLALVASYIGVAAIIGALPRGMALSESAEGTDLPRSQAVTEFLLPFFLTNLGMQLKLDAILNLNTIILALTVTILAVLSKLIGCGLAALRWAKRRRPRSGWELVPRGEVGVV